MNEKTKDYMNDQKTLVLEKLSNTFNLDAFEDELGEDEQPSAYFLVVYGDMRSTNSVGQLSQDVYIVYVSEDNPDVETITIDVITTISRIKGFTFNRTIKERLQKDETNDFVDQVTLMFRRTIPYEH